MKKIDEKELKLLFQKLKNNDKSSIEELYSKYFSTVYGIAFSILRNKENSEDVSQNVFAKLLKLDSDKFPSQGEASWLYTVTKNEVIQFLRKQKQIVDIDDLYSLESESNEIDDIVDMTSYYNLIENLKPIEKEIISLRILSDFTFEKIAQMLNMPIGTVEWKYYKSLHSIKLSISNLAAFIVLFTTWQAIKIETVEESSNNSQITDESTYSSGDSTRTCDFSAITVDTITESSSDTTSASSVAFSKSNILSISLAVLSLIFMILSVFFALKKKIKIKK